MEANLAQLESCMYQYSRAIYRSIKDLVDPYADSETRVEYRRAVLAACEDTVERLEAVQRLIAEETRVSMLIGVAVGYELAYVLNENEGEG